MAGLWFEEFEEGQVFNHSLSCTITEADNMMFCNMTLNTQPLRPWKVLRHSPPETDHSFKVLSPEPDTTVLPSGLKATLITQLPWPSKVLRHSHESKLSSISIYRVPLSIGPSGTSQQERGTLRFLSLYSWALYRQAITLETALYTSACVVSSFTSNIRRLGRDGNSSMTPEARTTN